MIKQETTAPLSSFLAPIAQFLNQTDRLWLTRPVIIFVATRLLIFACGYFAMVAVPPNPNAAQWDAGSDYAFVNMWARFDSGWYLGIAREGYYFKPEEQSPVAFFPLYPILITAATTVTTEPVIAALLVSNLAFLIALIFLYQLTIMVLQDRDAATRTLFYIALFPTSLFFSAVYSEGLFLLLCVGTFYFALKHQWSDAALFGFLCSATRIVGVVVWLVVALEWLWAHGWQFRTIHRREAWQHLCEILRADWPTLVIICMIPLGLAAYMFFLWVRFGDPVAFLTAEAAWHNNFIGPLAVISRAMDYTLRGTKLWGEPPIFDVVTFFIFLAISVAAWRRLGASYGLFALLCILIPISSTTQSMMRYVVVVFPAFMMLGLWGKNRWLHWFLMIVFSILLGIFMITYVSWRFVG